MTLSPINTEGRPSASPGTPSPKYSPTGLSGTCDDKISNRQTDTQLNTDRQLHRQADRQTQKHTAKYRQTTTQTDQSTPLLV